MKNICCFCRKLNMGHQLIERVRQNSRKVLCVIVGVAKLAGDGSIHLNTNISAEEKEDAVSCSGEIS